MTPHLPAHSPPAAGFRAVPNLLTSQTRTVVSELPDTRRVPSGEKATELTDPRWPWNLAPSSRPGTAQTRTSDPNAPATKRASRENVSVVNPGSRRGYCDS